MISIRQLESMYGYDEGAYRNAIGANDAFFDLHNTIFDTDIFCIEESSSYPLSEERVRRSGYVARPNDEKAILDRYFSVTPDNFFILVGPEGSGKSTCLHYTLGYALRKRIPDTYSRTFFILSDTVAWLDIHKSDGFKERIFSFLHLKLLEDKFADRHSAFEKLLSSFSERLRSGIKAQIADPGKFVTHFLAFLSASTTNSTTHPFNTVLIFDNMDTLTGSQQRDLASALTALQSEVLRLAREYYSPPDSMQQRSAVCFFVPMRRTTWETLTSGQGAIWPTRKTESAITLGENSGPQLWRMLTERLVRLPRFTKAALNRISMKKIQTESGVSFGFTVDDAEDYICSLIWWLRSKDDVFSTRFLELCGGSLRRALLFAIKIVGHPCVEAAFDEDVLLRRPKWFNEMRRLAREAGGARFLFAEEGLRVQEVVKRAVTAEGDFDNLMWHSIFDPFELIGSQGTLHVKTILTNPFRLIVNRDVLQNNPLIGYVILTSLEEVIMENNDIVESAKLVALLRGMGYEEAAITEALQTCVNGSLLRRIGRRTSGIHDAYHVDLKAWEMYLKCVRFNNFNRSWAFSVHAIRDVFSLRRYVPVTHILDRLLLGLLFVSRVLDAEQRLMQQLRAQFETGPLTPQKLGRLESYSHLLISNGTARRYWQIFEDFRRRETGSAAMIRAEFQLKFQMIEEIWRDIAERTSRFGSQSVLENMS
jgi:energy-coupling factor transporter ATP-binding protein EcfA2